MESRLAALALGALGQETRLAIYRLLVGNGPEGLAAGHIGAALGLPPATLSFHLRELSHAGLVAARQQSRFIYYSADVAAMRRLLEFLDDACCPDTGASQAAPAGAARLPPAAAKPVIRPKTRGA